MKKDRIQKTKGDCTVNYMSHSSAFFLLSPVKCGARDLFADSREIALLNLHCCPNHEHNIIKHYLTRMSFWIRNCKFFFFKDESLPNPLSFYSFKA